MAPARPASPGVAPSALDGGSLCPCCCRKGGGRPPKCRAALRHCHLDPDNLRRFQPWDGLLAWTTPFEVASSLNAFTSQCALLLENIEKGVSGSRLASVGIQKAFLG